MPAGKAPATHTAPSWESCSVQEPVIWSCFTCCDRGPRSSIARPADRPAAHELGQRRTASARRLAGARDGDRFASASISLRSMRLTRRFGSTRRTTTSATCASSPRRSLPLPRGRLGRWHRHPCAPPHAPCGASDRQRETRPVGRSGARPRRQGAHARRPPRKQRKGRREWCSATGKRKRAMRPDDAVAPLLLCARRSRQHPSGTVLRDFCSAGCMEEGTGGATARLLVVHRDSDLDDCCSCCSPIAKQKPRIRRLTAIEEGE